MSSIEVRHCLAFTVVATVARVDRLLPLMFRVVDRSTPLFLPQSKQQTEYQFCPPTGKYGVGHGTDCAGTIANCVERGTQMVLAL